MKRYFVQAFSVLTVLAIHCIYSVWDIYTVASRYGEVPISDLLMTYLSKLWVVGGLAWALAAAFLVYVVSKYIQTGDAKEILRGLMAPVIIFVAAYFLLGCGGPLYYFYIKNFGWFYGFFIDFIVLLLVLISTIMGYVRISRRTG
ncbi:hypothetical protein ACFL20_01250 [Spirochaetota bacterium]